jgi:tetratricopeptide (TPR) repeat protein
LQWSVSKSWLPVILIIAACTVVLIVYWPALSAKALVIDDDQYLGRNNLVQNPSWESTRRFLTEVLKPSTVRGYYQPLTMISLMFDYSIGGCENNLMPFHRTSLILHIANTALIIVLLYLLFGQIWVAAAVGLLFGVHPMTVEPVPWVGERKTLLAAFFALWCLVFYVIYTRKNDQRFYIWCFVMYLPALMSKPTSIPLPAVMLLMDYWPLGRLKWRTVYEKLPFFVLGGVFVVITYISQSRTSYAVLPGQYNPKFVPLILCHNIIFYLYKIIWPVNLSLHYAFPELLNMSEPMVLAGVIGTFILILLLVLSLRWTKGALTGFSVFFVAILPTMQIIGFSNVIASDKFVYLPSVGLLMILTSFVIWLSRTSYVAKAKIWGVVLAVSVLIPAGFESVATRRYLACWKDSVTLFEYVLKLTPDSPIINYSLGYEFQFQGRLDDAIERYRRALQVDPDYVEAYINIGVALEMKGQLDEAEGHLRRALQLAPSDANVYIDLANVYQLRGGFDKAIDYFKEALKINPNDVEAYIDLGIILASADRFGEAADCFRRVLKLEPDNEVALDNLARILAKHPQSEKRDAAEAVGFARQAAELTQYRNAAVLDTLAAAYAAAGQFDKAVAAEQAALDLASDSNDEELAAQIAKQLELYKQKKR